MDGFRDRLSILFESNSAAWLRLASEFSPLHPYSEIASAADIESQHLASDPFCFSLLSSSRQKFPSGLHHVVSLAKVPCITITGSMRCIPPSAVERNYTRDQNKNRNRAPSEETQAISAEQRKHIGTRNGHV